MTSPSLTAMEKAIETRHGVEIIWRSWFDTDEHYETACRVIAAAREAGREEMRQDILKLQAWEEGDIDLLKWSIDRLASGGGKE